MSETSNYQDEGSRTEHEENTAQQKVSTDKDTQEMDPEVDGISCQLEPSLSYTSCDPSKAVNIRFGKEKGSLSSTPAITVMEFLERAVEKFYNRDALKVEVLGAWLTFQYDSYLQNIKLAAKGFIKLGLEPYHGVGILGFNSPEWLFSDLGAIFAGGLATGIYTTNNVEACRYVLADASCNIAVVDSDAQLQKVLQVWDRLPQLKAIIQYRGQVKEKRENVYTWNELIEMAMEEDDTELEKRMNAQAPNKCCTLIYTSGTTGDPKGVMLSHDNLIMSCENAYEAVRPVLDGTADCGVSYLPLSHITAQMTDVWVPIQNGACIYFARPDALKGSLVETLLKARPTLFIGVPRVYEKMEEKLKVFGATIQGFKRMIGDWVKTIALQGNINKEEGKPVPYGWTIATIFLKQLQKNLGLERCKMLVTGSAPMSIETLQYFQSLNLPLCEGYGLSEVSGAVTMNNIEHCRSTSIGKVLSLNEYEIRNPDEEGKGELCFRGRSVCMGYLNNEKKTKEAIDGNGWLLTGDIAKADEDGFLYIVGRIKEIIITAGGENIAPVPIEANIKDECPLIGSVMVIGDQKKFLSCLLTLEVEIDPDTGLSTDNLLPIAINYCKQLGLNVSKASEICPDIPEVIHNAVEQGIKNANKKAISNAARVQKWKLLPFEFTVAGGELGPVQKLRRPIIMKMYKEIIDSFYA